MLVVVHHVGQAYGPTGGWWYYTEPSRAPILGAFFTVNRSFFMSLFFMISGYFVPMSYDRKGGAFLKDRLARLGIPLLFFAFLVIPAMTYVYHLNFGPYRPFSFLSYYVRYYLPVGPGRDFNFGHLWFIEHLLIFAVCYRVWRMTPFAKKSGQVDGRPPKSFEIVAFALALAVVTFVMRLWYPIDRWIGFLHFIQVAFADVPRDLSFFVIGVIAYRRNWFLSMPKKAGMAWFYVGLAASAICLGLFSAGIRYFNGGGPTLGAFIFDLWESFLCCGLCIGFIVLFREGLNGQGRFLRDLAASTYGVYLFHVPVLVAFQYALAGAAFGPLTKFLLVLIMAIPATFALAAGLRRVPLARSVL
jgi:peptidoglycan/LPS O-acetylase OafA/YrhL